MREVVKERRSSKRFRLRLAVVFSWRDEHGILQSSEGCTCNISSRGIYVQTKCAPPLGNALEMNVCLPQPAYDIRAVEIHAKGHVTRVDQGPRAQVCGFAAMNRTVLIRDSIEHVLDEKDDAVESSRVAEQRIQSKQAIWLHRS
jgi:PilZ domain-containing protein